MMPKPPKEFCVDSFEYFEYDGLNDWSEPSFKEPVTIESCRIDKGAEFSTSASGKQLLYNAVVFCYTGITDPLPKFKLESIVHFDNQDHVITKVIPITEAYSNKLYSYELEVI